MIRESPKMVVDEPLGIGECPLWHPLERKVYWLDIQSGSIYRYDPEDESHERVYHGMIVGGFTIQADGALLLFMERGAVGIWRNGNLTFLIDEIPEERDTRFNDVIADPEGRVFCGTMPAKNHLGSLYRMDTNATLSRILEGIRISNGMAFTLNGKQIYYTDSGKGEIYLFDYDQKCGDISNRRLFLQIPKSEGEPDGMTVDAEGYVWSARWNGGCIIRYTPDGTEDFRVHFPAKKVSSLTFGGEECKDIYVTTAGGDNREEEGSGAGALFSLNLGIQGVPEFFSQVRL
jgi:sugar lactone lactonase YvrE